MLGRTGLLLCAVGCMSFTGVSQAQEQVCHEGHANGNHCNDCNTAGLKPFSNEWYEAHAGLPPGTRQQYKYGKLWPPYPRPTGPKGKLAQRYHDAHYWPHPYDCQDRAALNSHVSLQVARGWEDAVTLYDYHFDPETQELSQAGILHLQWILSDTPSQFRRALVQTSATEGANENRVASIQEVATRLSGGQQTLPIELRNTTVSGRPAIEVDMIRKAELGSIPDPRIQYSERTKIGN